MLARGHSSQQYRVLLRRAADARSAAGPHPPRRMLTATRLCTMRRVGDTCGLCSTCWSWVQTPRRSTGTARRRQQSRMSPRSSQHWWQQRDSSSSSNSHGNQQQQRTWRRRPALLLHQHQRPQQGPVRARRSQKGQQTSRGRAVGWGVVICDFWGMATCSRLLRCC